VEPTETDPNGWGVDIMLHATTSTMTTTTSSNTGATPSRLSLFRRRLTSPRRGGRRRQEGHGGGDSWSSHAASSPATVMISPQQPPQQLSRSRQQQKQSTAAVVEMDSSTSSGTDEVYSTENSPQATNLLETRLGISPPHYRAKRSVGPPASTTAAVVVSPEAASAHTAPAETIIPPSSLFTSLWEERSLENTLGGSQTNFHPATTTATKGSAMPGFFSRNDAKRKAKEIVQKAREKESKLPDTIKIFLLLLEPESKIFERIQLQFPVRNTTLADVLKLIPMNATETALARQHYIGITRPRRRAEPVTNLKLPATVYSGREPEKCATTTTTANIVHGEIILAIPAAASAREIVRLSKQILANAHIQKKLHVAAKLSPSRRKKHAPLPSTLLPSTESVLESKSATMASVPPTREAKTANATGTGEESSSSCLSDISQSDHHHDVACSSESSPEEAKDVDDNDDDCSQLTRAVLDAYLSKEDMLRVCGGTLLDHSESADSSSLDEDDDLSASTFRSWGQSLDSSVASAYATLAQEQLFAATSDAPRLRRKRLARTKAAVKRFVAGSLAVSIAWYHLDSDRMVKTTPNDALGVVGLVHFLFALVTLYKAQRLVQRRDVPRNQTRCPLMQFYCQLFENRVVDETPTSVKLHFA
jgi:hypothetical protein